MTHNLAGGKASATILTLCRLRDAEGGGGSREEAGGGDAGGVACLAECGRYLGVALHGVDERLVGHDLRVSVEEGLESVLGLLQLLLGDLQRQRERRRFRCEFSPGP